MGERRHRVLLGCAGDCLLCAAAQKLAIAAPVFAAILCLWSMQCLAYTSVGDRQFPAFVLIPQIAPSDALYLQGASYPDQSDDLPTSSVTERTFYGEFDKTITEDLSVGVVDGWGSLGQVGGKPNYGWQNFQALIRYRAYESEPHEFLFTVGAVREFGGTGAEGVEALPWGATTPTLAFGKGLGDLDIGVLRPFEIAGTLGYQLSDSAPRPNLLLTGFAIGYSMPYLESEVQTLALPQFLRGLTPLVEFLFVNPMGRAYGNDPTGTIAPGFNYAGEGWEVNANLLVPTTRATALGLGVRAQLTISLDYFFSNTIGRPLFGQ